MLTSRWRYVASACGILFLLHLLLSIHPGYREHFGLFPSSWGGSDPAEELGSWAGAKVPSVEYAPRLPSGDELRVLVNASNTQVAERRRARAAFVVLARNSDLWPMTESMRQMEDRFNYWANYDWIFLNDNDFSDDFKKYTQQMTNSKCHYGKIEQSIWNQPDWIDEDKAADAREQMTRKKIIYGHSVPYRNMCRFNAGHFFRHPLLDNLDYYWRVEPGVKFFCDLNYDPFLLMQDEKKVYGFTISLLEYIETIPTLWEATREFMKEHPELIPKDNALEFISDDGGETYNRCHFWSNFEIGDLNFWRSEPYMKYFEHLDRRGGFYYERWGDAPVHSIGAALFARKDQIHWFDDIGYRHEPFQHCPRGAAHQRGRCHCNPDESFDWEWYSCSKRFTQLFE